MRGNNSLVGYTGFVGGNILAQHDFGALFNSKNISEIRGKCFDLLVCCGARAEKWKANKDPAGDLEHINNLIFEFSHVKARQAVLVSTIDVYKVPNNVDEDSPTNAIENHAYGKHRYMLEEFFRTHFDATVVRLPGLFGTGLKKNIVFDFLHNNQVEKIDSRSVFQFYNLDYLWGDISRVIKSGIKLLNVATEPTTVAEIAEHAFDIKFSNIPPSAPATYNYRSKHASSLGGGNGYLYSKQQVLADLKGFVARMRKL